MDSFPDLASKPSPSRCFAWCAVFLVVALFAFPGMDRATNGVEGDSPSHLIQQDPGLEDPVQTDRPPVMPEPADVPQVVGTERAARPQQLGSLPSIASPPSTPTSVPVAGLEAASGVVEAKDYYGLYSLAPAIVAILLAIITRQVLVALVAGILVAAGMMLGLGGEWLGNPITVVTYSVEHYLFGVLASVDGGGVDDDHLRILVFTFFIGAMVGVIEANGGTQAMVARVTRRVKTRSRGQLGAFVAGIVVFFDDYANAMIVGPSMRPIFDRLRISREKLAYIVDSTAAPVASVFIGTWLAAEIGYLDEGLDALNTRPAFLEGITGNTAFWASLPYRTYAWLALAMVFIIAYTGRDFGGMRSAESREAFADGNGDGSPCNERKPSESSDRQQNELVPPSAAEDGGRWWLGAIPVFSLITITIGLLLYTGYASCGENHIALEWDSVSAIGESIKNMLGSADSYPALLYGALSAAFIAVALTFFSRALTLAKTMDAVVAGMSRMFTACIVLVLAWGLSQGGKDLQLGDVASVFLNEQVAAGVFSPILLPLAVFICAAIVSFSTGTSWGTMGILCPAVVAVSAGMLSGLPQDQAMPIFYAAVGAVLTGAVFGDHCSPISDTTVLSSIASECDLTKHVWTQMPYALTVAVVGLLCTDGLNIALDRWRPDFYAEYWQGSWAYGLGIGVVLLVFIVLIVGRRPSHNSFNCSL